MSSTDEARAREFCGLMPHESVTPDSYAGRVMALLVLTRAEEKERCARCLEELTDAAAENLHPEAEKAMRLAIGTIREMGSAPRIRGRHG